MHSQFFNKFGYMDNDLAIKPSRFGIKVSSGPGNPGLIRWAKIQIPKTKSILILLIQLKKFHYSEQSLNFICLDPKKVNIQVCFQFKSICCLIFDIYPYQTQGQDGIKKSRISRPNLKTMAKRRPSYSKGRPNNSENN